MLQSLFSKQKLQESWKSIYYSKSLKKRDFSKGVDGVSITDFKQREKYFIDEIYRQLNGGFFNFDPLFHFQQIKKGKKPRDIQAPTIKDRIVQKIINNYLSDVYFKSNFLKTGIVGSVKGTTLKNILKDVIKHNNQGFVYILKTDIKNYFPSINRKRLLKILSYYVRDRKLKSFLINYLNNTDLSGIPQGPPLSPTMANLYLHSLDQYLSKRKKIKHFRYVDDILIFAKNKEDLKQTYKFINIFFKKLGLKMHPLNSEKTKIGVFANGKIDVLGIICKKDKLFIKGKKIADFKEKMSFLNKNRTNLVLSMDAKGVNKKIIKLIEKTNYQLIGWGGAYLFCNIENEYKNIDTKIHKYFCNILDELEKTQGMRFSDNERNNVLRKIQKLSSLKINPLLK